MSSMTSDRKPSAGEKLFILAITIAGASHVVDFFLYGRHLFDLAPGVGFFLLAAGLYTNGMRGKPVPADRVQHPAAYYGSIFGLLLVIAGIVIKHWP